MQDSASKGSLSTAPLAGGRRSGAGRRDSTARSPSAPWPPPWAAPPWPLWNDADVSKEPWDLGKVPVPRDPFLMPVDEISETPTTSKEKKGSEKSGPRASKSKARASITSDEMYLPFDDPLGPGALPASLARRVRGWVRGSAVPRVALLAPSEDDAYGANARELPDLTTAAAYALRLSPLLRYMVASIRALYVMGLDEPIPLEPSDDYEPEIKSPWRPWHHIYSLCEATNTHPPTPQLNPAGKYVVRLFFLGAWRRITVDDRIPEDHLGRPLLPVILPTVDPSETEAANGDSNATGKGKGKGRSSKANGKAKNGDKGKGKGKAADGEENELGEGESLRIWPAILCKALLRVASLSWRGGVDEGECGELAGFSAVACLTGWVPQRLDLRAVVPSVAWALVHRLLGEDEEDPAQQYLGYVSPEEQAEAKKKAEEMLIPSKYNFPKKPPPPPPPLEIPLKDECLWEQPSIADPTAERLSPAAVMAVLREDLRLTPPALPCTVPCTASGTSTSSFDWGWLGSDTSLVSLRGGEEQEEQEEEEEKREEGGEDEEGEEEETSEMRKKREKEEAERLKKEKKRKEEEEQAEAEHKALAPRWSHPALLREARLFFDEDTSRPPTPLWQRHRWKAWAIERGLIPPERVRVERRVRVYAPLCGAVKIPPPPVAPGPLHPPIPPPPLPLGYPFKEFPPGVTEPVELGLDKIKDKKGGKSISEKKESLNKEGKSDSKTTEDKPAKNGKEGAVDGEAPWIRFDVLQPEILAIEVFYRPSTFAFKARLTSLVPANVQAQGAVLGAESSGGGRKSVSKVKDARTKSPGAESRAGLDKLPMPPEEFSCEPVFFLMDTISCKKVLFQLSVIADDVLHNLNILLQASNPEKPWLLQEAQTLSGPLKPYEHCTQTKNVSSGYLVAETYRWAEAGLGGAAFALKTNGACAMVVNVGEGLAVFRLWVKAPRHFSLLVLSPTTFALGGRGPVHGIMMKESESYLSRGAALAAAYTALMAEVARAPPLLRPPTPESNEYKKAALLGKEEGKHAQALKAFFEALLPPIMPELTPTKMELIWNRLMHRLEEALVPLVLEQVATPEECARGIRQWQVALQEPFFGAATLAAFEDPDRPNPRRTTSPPSQSGVRPSPKKAKPKGGSIEEEEGPMPVEELAGATRLYLGLDAPDAARAHPAKDECDVDAPARPESEETKETSTESGDTSEKEKPFRLSNLPDLGEPVVSLDDDMAITVLKRMLTDHPELLFLYPFRNDHLLRIYCTEYQGSTKLVSNRWAVLARCVINPHQEQPVLCAVFASVSGFPMPWVIMVDNSTMEPVAASSRYGAVEPFYIKKSEMGYTVLVVIEVAPNVKELPWLLRFAATKPEDVVHHCSAQTATPTPDAGLRTSTTKGSQQSLNKERRSNRLSMRDGGFPGRKSTASASAAPPPSPANSTPASPVCPGPQPPPKLLQLVIDGLYTAPSDAIVTSAILRLPLPGAWVPNLLLSFHIRLSSPQAKFRFTVEDLRTDKILLETSSVGHKTIPAFFVSMPQPAVDVEEQERKLTSTSISEAVLRADAMTAGIRLEPPQRAATAFRLSGVSVMLTLRLTVFVRVGEWPLSPHEFENVDEAKEKERRESRLFGDEVLGGEEEDEGLVSNTPRRPPPPASEHGGARSPASAMSSTLDDDSTPRFLLAVVVDADKVPGADLTSDVPRALCLRMLKESWEAEQPGRHLVANKARQDFLRRREEGEHLLAAAEMAAAAVEGALDLEDIKADILHMLINRGAWPSATMVPASLASPPPLTSPGRLAATAAAAAASASPSKSPPAPPPTTGSSPATTATTASSTSDRPPDPAAIAAERPVVRTLDDMLEEMIEQAYTKQIISDPLGREHVTPLEVQLDHLDVEKKIENEKLKALELFRDVKFLRGVQVRIGTFAELSLSRSETQAAEAALAAKENRDKAIADSKGKGKEPDKDRKSRKSTLGKK